MEQEAHTHQKALAINLDEQRYGTLAEIGAGQETARWFFRVGGAAGTIAKAMSAYDMTFSDAIYGKASRYVSRERLEAMLDHEYGLLLERLAAKRGENTAFFAFANTVAARSFTRKTDGHGWLGIRFQTVPRAEPSQIHIHVILHGKNHIQDQETLGILGVNLIHGALYAWQDPDRLIQELLDNLFPEVVEIDMVDFSGPAFTGVDNRIMALRLVQRGLSGAAMFQADGSVIQIMDALYKKAVLVERSRFRPPTHLTLEMMDRAHAAFRHETGLREGDVLLLSEMTLHNLSEQEGGEIDIQDFLDRADILCALGKNVLISNFGEYYRLAQFLFRYTKLPIAIALGLPTLRAIFNEKYYEDLPGGILESFGRMFKHDLRIYACPELNPANGDITTVETLEVAPHLQHLYRYLCDNGFIKPLEGISTELLAIHSPEVLEDLRRGGTQWESQVPARVAEMIRQRHLFGAP